MSHESLVMEGRLWSGRVSLSAADYQKVSGSDRMEPDTGQGIRGFDIEQIFGGASDCGSSGDAEFCGS